MASIRGGRQRCSWEFGQTSPFYILSKKEHSASNFISNGLNLAQRKHKVAEKYFPADSSGVIYS